MSLLADLSAGLERSRRAAVRRYGAVLVLMDRAEHPPGGAGAADARREAAEVVEELKSLMQYLGKSEAEVMADARIVRDACDARERSTSLPPDIDAQVEAATAALNAYDAQTAELMKGRRAEYFRLYNAACDLDARRSAAYQASQRLERMRRAQPELLEKV